MMRGEHRSEGLSEEGVEGEHRCVRFPMRKSADAFRQTVVEIA